MRLARERPGELSLVAVGPLTNVGLALMLEPRLPELVRQVVVMGGAVGAPGNISELGEANVWHDPEAAALVVEAPWDVLFVGLEITMRTALPPAAIERIGATEHPVGRLAWRIMQHYLDVYEKSLGVRSCVLHDPLALALALDPALATYRTVKAYVDTGTSPSRGAIVGDLRASVPARTPRNRAPSGSSTPWTRTPSTSASSRPWGREACPRRLRSRCCSTATPASTTPSRSSTRPCTPTSTCWRSVRSGATWTSTPPPATPCTPSRWQGSPGSRWPAAQPGRSRGVPPSSPRTCTAPTGRGTAAPAGLCSPAAAGTAAEQIIRIAREHPGEAELVAVGPLTNVALALGLCPELPSLLCGVTIMGGAALASGNVTEVAEANIWHDPEAAAAVFAADWPLTMVGLDVTMTTTLDGGQLDRLETGGSLARYVAGIIELYAGFFAETAFGERRSCMHDLLAVAIAAGTLVPDVAPVVHARVDTGDGPGRGQTICDLRGRYMGYPEQPGARCRVVLSATRPSATRWSSCSWRRATRRSTSPRRCRCDGRREPGGTRRAGHRRRPRHRPCGRRRPGGGRRGRRPHRRRPPGRRAHLRDRWVRRPRQRRGRSSEAAGVGAVVVPADVRDHTALAAAVAAGMDAFGRLDVLVANAGIASWPTATWQATEEQWRTMLDVVLTGSWNTCRAAIPAILAGGRGGAIC